MTASNAARPFLSAGLVPALTAYHRLQAAGNEKRPSGDATLAGTSFLRRPFLRLLTLSAVAGRARPAHDAGHSGRPADHRPDSKGFSNYFVFDSLVCHTT
jgi:hypothetical protein